MHQQAPRTHASFFSQGRQEADKQDLLFERQPWRHLHGRLHKPNGSRLDQGSRQGASARKNAETRADETPGRTRKRGALAADYE